MTGYDYITSPPSTCSVCPVIYPAPGETRNAIAAATSSGIPTRPSGTLATWRRSRSGLIAACAPGSLRMKPGATAFTVTPEGASSIARARTSASTAALAAADAANTVVSVRNVWATKLETATTRGSRPAFRCGIAARAKRKNPPWTASTDAAIAASVNSANAVRSANPALLTSTSNPPNRPRHQRVRHRSIGKFTQRHLRVRARSPCLRCDTFSAVAILARVHQNRDTGFCQRAAHGCANAACRTRHQNNPPAIHPLHHVVRPQPAQLGVGVGFDLQRRMADAEAIAQCRGQLVQPAVACFIDAHQMRGQGRIRSTQAPDVQVMHFQHAGH